MTLDELSKSVDDAKQKLYAQEQTISLVKSAYRAARVWKSTDSIFDKYNEGWNDCIKEQKRLEKKFLEHIKSL